jgi:hypothetical protein
MEAIPTFHGGSSTMMRSVALLCTIVALLGLRPAFAQDAEKPDTKLLAYSARFYCSQPQDRTLPGNCSSVECWDTEIALANPGRLAANITIWVVEARPISQDPPPTRSEPAIELTLAPNDAVRIGCGSIDRLLPAEEMLGRARKAQPNGFLRVESDKRINAVATYVYRLTTSTSQGEGAGVGVDVVELKAEGEM